MSAVKESIKAIETSYQGYRFRSRLEARWAVFLDTLGLQWEYEVEGYDLGEAGYYLPDFRVSWQEKDFFGETLTKHLFLEVKPSQNKEAELVKLYLAGKFTGGTGKNTDFDWREPLADLRSHCYSSSKELPIGKHGDSYCGFSYIGPYPVDLVSGHAGVYGHFEGNDCHYTYNEEGEIVPIEEEEMREIDQSHITVKDTCLANISLCDVFFAWIDSPECYGTLAEIGFAKGRGKWTCVGVSPEMQGGELWFVQSMADRCVVATTPEEAFYQLFPLSEEEKKAKALAKEDRTRVFIVYGQPADHFFSAFDHNEFVRGCSNLGYIFSKFNPKQLERAALAARSARFEHGESGARLAA